MVAQSFWRGLTVLSRGSRLMKAVRGTWKYLVIPTIIDLSVLAFGVIYGAPWIAANVKAWTLNLSVWGPLDSLLSWIFLVLAWSMALILWLLVVYLVASILSLPFYSQMSEHVIRALGVAPKGRGGFGAMVHMLKVGLIKSLVFFFLAMVLTVVAFVPGFNLLALIATMVIVAADSLDYTFEALRFSFCDRKRHWREHLPFLFGVAIILALTSLVPGLTLLLQPFFILGCLDYFVEQVRGGRVQI